MKMKRKAALIMCLAIIVSNVCGCSFGKEKNNQDNTDNHNINISEENGADSINEGGVGEIITKKLNPLLTPTDEIVKFFNDRKVTYKETDAFIRSVTADTAFGADAYYEFGVYKEGAYNGPLFAEMGDRNNIMTTEVNIVIGCKDKDSYINTGKKIEQYLSQAALKNTMEKKKTEDILLNYNNIYNLKYGNRKPDESIRLKNTSVTNYVTSIFDKEYINEGFGSYAEMVYPEGYGGQNLEYLSKEGLVTWSYGEVDKSYNESIENLFILDRDQYLAYYVISMKIPSTPSLVYNGVYYRDADEFSNYNKEHQPWYEAYEKFFTNQSSKKKSLALAYIDDDYVPEMIYSPDPTTNATGYKVYTYKDGQVTELASSMYKPRVYGIKSGYFSIYPGRENTTAYKLENGKITSDSELIAKDGTVDFTYMVDGVSASKESYNTRLNTYPNYIELKMTSYYYEAYYNALFR